MKSSSDNSIKSFLDQYKKQNKVRLHMPGHKGSFSYIDDITEVKGADSLYEAEGIIAESEKRTAELFDTAFSFYSTEGSSQIIKAMCYLAMQRYYGKKTDSEEKLSPKRLTFVASRNAHKSFIYASMLLGFNIKWLEDEGDYSLCKCSITPDKLGRELSLYKNEINSGLCADLQIAGVYITSPDYLGNILDIEGLAEAAHRYDLPLIVDNAHGSYLKFLEKDIHPVNLGADIVADSAHKTLPALTGSAYLHISKTSLFLRDDISEMDIRKALIMFGSTSPSYLILESMDMIPERINKSLYQETEKRITKLKQKLYELGYKIPGWNQERPAFSGAFMQEALKIVIDMRGFKLTARDISEFLREKGIECEYADPDFLVTMWSPYNPYPQDYETFEKAMIEIAEVNDLFLKKNDKSENEDIRDIEEIRFKLPKVKYQPYQIMYWPHHEEKVGKQLIGRTAADTMVSCPPAVSPVVAGEIIDENIVRILEYYGAISIQVLDE